MKVSIVRIGNSRGIRIPKSVLDQCGFGAEAEMTVKGKALVVAPARSVRAGWDAAFAEMARRGDDAPSAGAGSTAWDEAEWRW
jgi:antitoxin MazE